MKMSKRPLMVFLLLIATSLSAQMGLEGTPVIPGQEGQFIKKAEAGDVEAAFRLGLTYSMVFGQQDYPKALKYLNMAADKNHAGAEWALGNLYSTGRGVDRDDQKAADLYVRSADHGSAMAQVQACTVYSVGRGVPKDPVKAFGYCRQSAEQNNAFGQFQLGMMYIRGNGVQENKLEGQKWIAKSAASGFPLAQEELARLKSGAAEQAAGNPSGPQSTTAIVRSTGNSPDEISQAELNKLMNEGKLSEDPAIAAALYEKASKGSANPAAWYELARLYESGKGVALEHAKALELLTKAAKQEYIPALYRLGEKYRDALGVERDNEESYKFFALAAHFGSREAQREQAGVARYLTPDQVTKGDAAVQSWIKEYPRIDSKLLR